MPMEPRVDPVFISNQDPRMMGVKPVPVVNNPVKAPRFEDTEVYRQLQEQSKYAPAHKQAAIRQSIYNKSQQFNKPYGDTSNLADAPVAPAVVQPVVVPPPAAPVRQRGTPPSYPNTAPAKSPSISTSTSTSTSKGKATGGTFMKGYGDKGTVDALSTLLEDGGMGGYNLKDGNSVKALQKELGITVDGKIGPETINAIADRHTRATSQPATVPGSPVTADQLGTGSSYINDWVAKNIQPVPIDNRPKLDVDAWEGNLRGLAAEEAQKQREIDARTVATRGYDPHNPWNENAFGVGIYR